jgi:hypothetical protein
MILSQTARAIAAIFFLIRMQSSVDSILVPPKKSHRSGAGERAIKRVIRVIPGSPAQAGGRNAVHEVEKEGDPIRFTHNREKHPVYDGFRIRASPRHGGTGRFFGVLSY